VNHAVRPNKYLPHQNKREYRRRVRQAFRGQLPADQFKHYSEYQKAVDGYLLAIRRGQV
jgi:AICAR transformylase/IMP cyclohydrolase PurH